MSSRPARMLAFAVALALLLFVRPSESADQELPPSLLGDFIAKVSTYDKSFQNRARPRALIVVLQKRGDNASGRVALGVARRLEEQPAIAGLPRAVEGVTADTPAALAAMVRERHVAVVVLSTGFDEQLPDYAAALDKVDVLTFGVVDSYARRGVVVALDIREGKPRIVVNMGRARAQNVVFGSELLKLAEVIP